MRPSQPSFADWYSMLIVDAQLNDKKKVVENIGLYVLKIFYEEGAKPTIDGLLKATQE